MEWSKGEGDTHRMATKQPMRRAPKEASTSIIAGMLTLVWGKRTNGQAYREGHQGRIYVIIRTGDVL
jgi:hypothetical protein